MVFLVNERESSSKGEEEKEEEETLKENGRKRGEMKLKTHLLKFKLPS